MVDVIPTPGVAYETVDDRFDCGIMISASHNPYTDNGIKLMNGEGCKMDEEVLQLIEDYIDGKSEIPFASGDEIGCTVDYMQGRNRYIAHLIASANFSLQGVKIGLDCANGSASSVAKPVFDALGADVRVISNAPDGFNINVDCGSTHMERLRRHVLEQGLDVGFAYDGDADRCLAVDDRGNVVDGDMILYVCGTYLHKHGRLTAGTVVPTVMSNLGLFKALDQANLKYETTPVGDKYVTACMREKGYSLGGEQSGHVIFGDIETTGDGIMTSLRIMEVMRAERMSLSELCSPVKILSAGARERSQRAQGGARRLQAGLGCRSCCRGTAGRARPHPGAHVGYRAARARHGGGRDGGRRPGRRRLDRRGRSARASLRRLLRSGIGFRPRCSIEWRGTEILKGDRCSTDFSNR